jgi:hypothetical protein
MRRRGFCLARIIYQVFADRIEIVAIRHSAESLDLLPDEF